jgi:hypothetical protein
MEPSLKYIFPLLGLPLILASGCKEEDPGQEVNYIRYELVSHYDDMVHVHAAYLTPSGEQQPVNYSLSPGETVKLFTFADSLAVADSISCGECLVFMKVTNGANNAVFNIKDLLQPESWEHTRMTLGNEIIHTCSTVIDSAGFRLYPYPGIYHCTIIKEAWYEIPEIDTIIYWCDTVQEDLEFLTGSTPEYVIIKGSSYGELYVDDGHFEYFDPTGMFSDPWIDGYFLAGDSLFMKKGWWSDAQYRHLNSYFGKK